MAINGLPPKIDSKAFAVNARNALARENKTYNDFNFSDLWNNALKLLGQGDARPTHQFIGDDELRAVVTRVTADFDAPDEPKLGTLYALDALIRGPLRAEQNEYRFTGQAPAILLRAKDELAFRMGARAAYFVRDNLVDQPELRSQALLELEDFANRTMNDMSYHGIQGTALKQAVVEVKHQLGIDAPNKGWRP